MFGMSFTELTLILVVAFIVLGPKRMAEFAKELGKWVNQIKSQMQSFKTINWDKIDAPSKLEDATLSTPKDKNPDKK